MKTLTTTMLFMLIAVMGAFAQNNNMVVFAEGGERFTLILNGIRQNATPETNVKVTGLNAPNYKVKIIFESKSLFDIDQNIYLQYGGESTGSNTEYTYSIVNKKGKYKIRPVSAAPINTSAPVAANQTVVTYTTTDAVLPVATTTTTTGATGGTVTTNVNGQTNGATVTTTAGGQTAGGTVTTTTTTTGTTTPTGENVSIGMNVNGVGVNMNVNINDGTGMAGTQTTTTTTSTTYSSTVTTSGTGTGTTTTTVPVTPASNSGCVYGMSSSEFESAKSSIEAKSFEDSKMTMAKQVIKNNCLTTSQVKEIMQIFSFEDTKLDLAKYAYNRTVDPNNYYKLNDAFTFETSIEELDKYIESQKK